ncbi:type VI secretion system membrane subunit TssM [Beijerinckia mobilis]|uniref:type VI secretion system membrane subunit TssM n=1 Tax=Beijerinckia mobilis TaxID=231434 RepID=UPI000555A41B|nr:type VI secretion system membrane subunit TssM [Beijerinckia mobilis]
MIDKPGIKGDILRIVLYGLGFASISGIVYVAGPFIDIGGWKPLDNAIIRDIVIVLLIATAGAAGGLSFWRRRKKAAALTDGIANDAEGEDDSQVLAGRMQDALATLKKSAKGGSTYLYDLPWYIIIGPPGSGKTTALVNSGLRFPLSGGATPEAIAGAGGTRYCDWWFAEDAVFIDTAGRYTMQDSDAALDNRSWFAFLDLLKKNRPRQPINGVLVAISIEDVLLLPAQERAAHARAIRARLLELHERLKVDFPVYAVFTKMDLIAGFTEFFADLGGDRLRSVFGATFQTTDKKLNLVSEAPREFDAVIERLNLNMLDRLQEEPNPANRVLLYGFPAQMAALKRPVHDFLNAIFEPTRYHSNANLRGFYFTSGTQEGTPIDQLINALVKNFGARDVGALGFRGLGKSFFLYDLVEKIIIGEAAWVSTDPAAVRRALILKISAFALIGMITVGAGFMMWKSYSANVELAAAAATAAREYAADPNYALTHQSVVEDRDYEKVLGLLQKLRDAPTSYTHQSDSPSFFEGLGFGQRARLASASAAAYHIGLERLLRPRLLYRLEEELEAHRDDPAFLYDALKVYMMIGHVARPIDRDLIVAWERNDWQKLFRGPMTDTAKALEQHLDALLDLDDGEAFVHPNQTLIEDSQKTLARLRLSERAYALLKSQARALQIPDWIAVGAGGLLFDQLFEEAHGRDLDIIRVPGFFTYEGFRTGLLQRLPGIAEKVRQERWVLGKLAEDDATNDLYRTLGNDLLALYGRDFEAAWREALAQLKMKRLNADKPRYKALGAATASNSPLKLLFESIVAETALTRERKPKKEDGDGKGGSGPRLIISEIFPGRGDRPPGEEIEKAFLPLQIWLDGSGTRRPIDEMLAELNDIKDNLITSATLPENSPQANAALAQQLKKFRGTADRLPEPFRAMLTNSADALDRAVIDSELEHLSAAFAEQVASACQQVVPGRYPFVKGATSEIALADFGRLFGPNGIFDSFFKQALAKYVDSSKIVWTYRSAFPLTAKLSAATLREFQRAAQIRDAFFPTGGNLPNIALTVYPPPLSGPGMVAKLETNGQEVSTSAGTSVVPRSIQWPGAGGGRSAVSLSVEPDQNPAISVGFQQPAAQAPIVLERFGAWSLFRLLDAASRSYSGDQLNASFSLGKRTVAFSFQAGSTLKPLTLPALSEIRCPSQL